MQVAEFTFLGTSHISGSFKKMIYEYFILSYNVIEMLTLVQISKMIFCHLTLEVM
jgi:hypothetical protein